MGRGDAWISRYVIVGIQQSCRLVKSEPAEDKKEDNEAEQILHRVIGMEWDCVAFTLRIDAGWIVRAEAVQRDEMQTRYCNDYEWQ